MQTPWRTGPAATVDPAAPLAAIATEFIVERPLARLAFLWRATRIAREARVADGMVGMTMEANLRTGAFRTVSVWDSPDAARAYARSGRHAVAAGGARAKAPKAVGRWSVTAGDLPLDIDASRRHLEPHAA